MRTFFTSELLEIFFRINIIQKKKLQTYMDIFAKNTHKNDDKKIDNEKKILDNNWVKNIHKI